MASRDVFVLGRPEPAPIRGEGIGRVEPLRRSASEPEHEDGGRVPRGVEEASDAIPERVQDEAHELLAAARRTRAEADAYAAEVRSAVNAYASREPKQFLWRAPAAKANAERSLADPRARKRRR